MKSHAILSLVEASKPIASLHNVKVKDTFVISRQLGKLLSVEWQIDPIKSYLMRPVDRTWKIEVIEKPISTKKEFFTGTVATSLWNSALEAGTDPQVIMQMTEIFSWQVDFNREVRAGDTWKLAVEQHSTGKTNLGYGKILVAEYTNKNQTFTAILNELDGQYYQPNGKSLRSIFLRSPIKFGRVTSGFSHSRFHPVLKRRRPHRGVDYGAPRGTPVRTIGKGTVVFAGRKGSSGIMVKIRHNSVYQTAYLHLSKIASKVRKGLKVKQGQTIGYVGSTGLATGPHLHFSFYEHGRFVDPLNRKFAPASPIPESHRSEFEKKLALVPLWLQKGSDFNEKQFVRKLKWGEFDNFSYML